MAKADNGSGQGASGNPRRLVIVESPTKARKIAPYLGKDYVVEASVGHIRDLPRGAADVPAKYKGESWARLGVNVDHDFEPLYVVSPEKKGKVAELKSLLKDADELFLATDPDREGEAIAWHLLETLKPKIPVRRMVFHEITEPAIRAAAEDTRELDTDLVDAQETRRILDRLYGYEVSPVLWKKVMPKLSAGRVQSVATRVIVQRERERMAFKSASYWDISATLDAGAEASPRSFGARLVSVDGSRVASGRDFGADGKLKGSAVTVLDEAYARRLAEALQGVDLTVSSAEDKPYTRKPYPPFMTSTLQQEAGRKLRFTSERAMRIAQRLYENGYITYMRTDRRLSRSRRSLPLVRRPPSCTVRNTCIRRRVSTPARSRTRRKPTRRSAPPATCSRPRVSCTPSSIPTSSSCTNSSGSGPSPRRWPTPAVRR